MDTGKCLGTGVDFPFEGTVYRIGDVTQGVKAQFEAWLKGRAFADLELAVRNMTPEAAQAQRRELIGMMTAGEFAFGTPLVSRAALSGDGAVELLYLLLCDGNLFRPVPDRKDFDRGLARRMLESAEHAETVAAVIYMAIGLDPTTARETAKKAAALAQP